MRRGRTVESVQEHLGRIGNLLLLPISLNQQAKTKPFADKKDLYEKHNLRMVKEVCSEAEWSFNQINERENKIIEWAKTRWSDL